MVVIRGSASFFFSLSKTIHRMDPITKIRSPIIKNWETAIFDKPIPEIKFNLKKKIY